MSSKSNSKRPTSFQSISPPKDINLNDWILKGQSRKEKVVKDANLKLGKSKDKFITTISDNLQSNHSTASLNEHKLQMKSGRNIEIELQRIKDIRDKIREERKRMKNLVKYKIEKSKPLKVYDSKITKKSTK